MDFTKVEKEILHLKPLLNQASEVILSEDVSRYPIFILSEEGINAGISITQAEVHNNLRWNINASTLEEFYVKKMISAEHIDDFKKAYKSPEANLCLFIVSGNEAKFVFISK